MSAKLIASTGCEFNTHCSGDCPMPFLAISESVIRAWRGDPRPMDLDRLVGLAKNESQWVEKLRAYCKVMQIPTKGLRAGWWMVSDHG